jgi:hypothetical protein
MEIDSVRKCVGLAREYMNTDAKEEELVGPCRNADVRCVREVGERLDSSERRYPKNLIPIIRACDGKGMGECYLALVKHKPVYDFNEAHEALALLKKCE